MADVFISYAHEDRELAEKLTQELTNAGLTFWWSRKLRSGYFPDEIRKQLKEARAVVAIWTPQSTRSRYVRNEASFASRKEKLINVHLPEIEDPQEQIPDFLAETLHSIEYFETTMVIEAIGMMLQNSTEVEDLSAVRQIERAETEDELIHLLDKFPRLSREIEQRAATLGLVAVDTGPIGKRQRRWLEVGAQFSDLPFAPRLVVIKQGTFLMGAPNGEIGARKDEYPQHKVTIQHPLAVGGYPVTVAEWEEARKRGFDAAAQIAKNENLPSTHVGWHAAKAYTAWLRRQTGFQYRLLSEAEWEYCCRAGTEEPFAVKTADFNGSYSKSGAFARNALGPVGSDPPNKFGLHDMQGKVWEWVEDDYHFSYQGAPIDGSPWCGQQSEYSKTKVLRGGCFASGIRHIRAGRRARCLPLPRQPEKVGFRVARPL